MLVKEEPYAELQKSIGALTCVNSAAAEGLVFGCAVDLFCVKHLTVFHGVE